MYAGGHERGTERRSQLWNPDDGSITHQPFALLSPTDTSDPFCSHHCFLPDGRLLVMGGTIFRSRGSIRASWLFDPVAERWSRGPDMDFERWYPTSLALPDGRVLVASGRDSAFDIVTQVEVYDPTIAPIGRWQTLPATANRSMDIYPSLHLVPAGPHAGKILFTGTRWREMTGTPQTALFDRASNTWSEIGPLTVADRTEGFSVQVPPAENARIMVFGGGYEDLSITAEILDLLAPTLAWQRVGDMSYERTNTTGVILPNGTVFAFGGFTARGETVLAGDIYVPDMRAWIETADMVNLRGYHSFGMLLPDGRVFVAGEDPTMEIFSPPYMEMPRPAITNAPRAISYGRAFSVEVTNPGSIASVVLIRPMAITHHTDTEQRHVRLSFMLDDDGQLLVTAPGNGNLAPPGYYMMFVIDAAGTPSIARFVRLVPRRLIKPVKDIKDKEHKDVKDKEVKEKDFKELKEDKEVKEKEIKDLKEKELKDLKEKDRKDFKEKDRKDVKEKDIKEKDKELKEKDKEIREGFEGLAHFILQELRPDLVATTLDREPDPQVPAPREPTAPKREVVEAFEKEVALHDARRPKLQPPAAPVPSGGGRGDKPDPE